MKIFVYHNLISVELGCIKIFFEFITRTLGDNSLISNIQQTCKKCHSIIVLILYWSNKMCISIQSRFQHNYKLSYYTSIA